jgi:hypothetical protein
MKRIWTRQGLAKRIVHGGARRGIAKFRNMAVISDSPPQWSYVMMPE